MKYFLVIVAIVWGLFQLAGLFSGARNQSNGESLEQFAKAPPHRLADPYRNAYFFLIGFAAAPSLDPSKTGYEMWIEAGESTHTGSFDYEKPGRSDLRVHVSPSQILPEWEADDPLEAFRRKQSSVRTLTARYQTLLTRYDRCLGMPFEDWGYGLHATMRFAEPLIVHRLYVAEGFSRLTTLGLERLYREMIFWRTVLRESATPATKVMAQLVIQDDTRILSRLLSKPPVDKAILSMGLQLTLPLTHSEYSLRWPIQHQVFLALHQDRHRITRDSVSVHDEEDQWLLKMANLPAHTFGRIEHPQFRSLLGLPINAEQTGDLYAAYYETLIRAAGPGQGIVPRLQQVAGTMRRGMLESLMHPVLQEPEWDPLVHQLMETDARLRLTSLQIQLRRQSGVPSIPTRLAELGSQYFDPYTGLPMLWSPTQQRLYSVGKDRLDDGGDPSFDITVPAVVSVVPKSPLAAPPASRKISRL